ncbi:MAG: hypothetical protein MI717_02265 [Spirochaetales bacterium]|nr:hypothetical protein [Spirochaetales bacterium]
MSAKHWENLIEEKLCIHPQNLALAMKEEATRLWTASGWKKEKMKGGVLVESASVSGVFAPSHIKVMRSRGLVKGSPEDLFQLITSPEGYAILDPVSQPEDHKHPPLETHKWGERGRLDVAVARASSPLMPPAEFVVLNLISPDEGLFLSKSVLHPQRPGGSVYCSTPVPSQQGEKPLRRALNTMGCSLSKAKPGWTELAVLNYVDMGFAKGQAAWLYNLINRRFFAPLYKRLAQALENN